MTAADDDTCPCGRSLADGEGWDGWCGECADRRERARSASIAPGGPDPWSRVVNGLIPFDSNGLPAKIGGAASACDTSGTRQTLDERA